MRTEIATIRTELRDLASLFIYVLQFNGLTCPARRILPPMARTVNPLPFDVNGASTWQPQSPIRNQGVPPLIRNPKSDRQPFA
jgi:hypothetical protein